MELSLNRKAYLFQIDSIYDRYTVKQPHTISCLEADRQDLYRRYGLTANWLFQRCTTKTGMRPVTTIIGMKMASLIY
jgi:hypothetical protein